MPCSQPDKQDRRQEQGERAKCPAMHGSKWLNHRLFNRVRFLFYRGGSESSPPAVKEHRPEGGDSRQNQQPETNARALCFGVQTLNSNPHEQHSKYQSETRVSLHSVDEYFCKNVKHRCRKPESQPH